MPEEHGGDVISAAEASGLKNIIDFSANINPLGMPAAVKEALIDNIDDYALYPDIGCRELRDAIARHYGLKRENIVCGNGAAEVIFKLAFAQRPRTALICAPTFSEYANALESAGCTVRHHKLYARDEFDVKEDILAAITDDTDMVFLCSPNNPTGRLINRELLGKILVRARAVGAKAVIDECFMDFVEQAGEFTALPFIKEYDELIVLKAFTKIYAMAGLRLGYALCGDVELCEKLRAFGPPWNVSAPAAACGIAAMKLNGLAERTAAYTAAQRKRLEAALAEAGMKTVGSAADYILFYSRRTDIYEQLLANGILIRRCSGYKGLDEHYFRTAVRSESYNDIFIEALRTIKCGS